MQWQVWHWTLEKEKLREQQNIHQLVISQVFKRMFIYDYLIGRKYYSAIISIKPTQGV